MRTTGMFSRMAESMLLESGRQVACKLIDGTYKRIGERKALATRLEQAEQRITTLECSIQELSEADHKRRKKAKS